MRPERSRRVKVALEEVRALGTAEAEQYLRALRQSDPEVARELDVLLAAQGPGQQERADGPDGHGGAHPTGGPTVSAGVRVTVSESQPAQASPGDADRSGQPTTGQVLGRFQLLRVLGRGGFGEVWQAYDPVLEKHVAVKVPLPGKPGSALPPATFLHEARKAASLRHPAIVAVHDVGESTGGWYIVTEFVEGENLRSRMMTGRLRFDRSARIIATVAGALHAAHLAGLVHRDVKPTNILLDRAGNPYLSDFGLAVREDELLAERSKVAGTLAYMPPEQICGDTHLMDGRADIYALGAVLYELLTDRPVFRAGDTAEYRELILRREPRPPRSIDDTIPEELERICLKCLAKRVRERYPTAQDLANDLSAWLAGGTPSTDRPAPVPGWLKAAVAAALILSLLGGIVGIAALSGAFAGGRPTTPPEPGGDPAPSQAPRRKVPTVKELVWSGGREQFKWEVLEKTDRLQVYTDSLALLGLGETNADSWEFSATLRQLNRVGQIGLILGYRKDRGTATARYELIRLLVTGDKVHLQRRPESYRLDEPVARPKGYTSASVIIAKPGREYPIRLVVRGNRLAEVSLDGKAVEGLVKVGKPPPADGAYGVYNLHSDGLFSNLRFDKHPIPLLAEPSAHVPEKP